MARRSITRKDIKNVEDAAADFEPNISNLADYRDLIKRKINVDVILEDEIRERNCRKIFGAARDAVWNLLFLSGSGASGSSGGGDAENSTKAAELLKEFRTDAKYYSPWDYNEWIYRLRDEILKRGMLDFWRDVIVKNELGPCWAKDCDYFDEIDDPAPAEFYRHAGCKAPFDEDGSSTETTNITAENITDFEPNIALENPVESYQKLMKDRVVTDLLVSDDATQNNYKKIAAAARNTIWKLLFTEPTASPDNQTKAALLLRVVKEDAGFYSPWEYNEWIVRFRDELLKRGMLDFWRDHVVKNELGPCWARDSDLFDDIEDPTVAEFYNHAGCTAPFKVVSDDDDLVEDVTPTTVDDDEDDDTAILDVSDDNELPYRNFDANISEVTPLEDYQNLMKNFVAVDVALSDELIETNYKKIFNSVRNTVWKLLFSEQPTKPENLQKAAALLKEHKGDAGFYSPWEYNDWIILVRDELLRRKMFDFWRDYMVKNELGPCWARDSDFFDDLEDPAPAAFYRHAGCKAPFATN